MSAHAANQGRVFLELFSHLRPHLRSDRNLPERLRALLGKDKRFGSRDRRLYRELCYTGLRYLPWIEPLLDPFPEEALKATVWLSADLPVLQPLRETLLAGWPALPATLAERGAFLKTSASLVPDWFTEFSPRGSAPEQLLALHSRAPLWIRIQGSDTEDVRRRLEAQGIPTEPTPADPRAFRVLREVNLTSSDAYLSGLFEIQDLGSQCVLGASPKALEGRWLDACAGAGGKTLQLASLVGADGHVDAYEPRPAARLENAERVRRSRQKNVTHLDSPPTINAFYDGVLIDAPCSGTGTWRRSPHLKASTSREELLDTVQLQGEILERYARCVRPGGHLIYVTCSLANPENSGVVDTFLAKHPEFRVLPAALRPPLSPEGAGALILPAAADTDGFYVAHLQRS